MQCQQSTVLFILIAVGIAVPVPPLRPYSDLDLAAANRHSSEAGDSERGDDTNAESDAAETGRVLDIWRRQSSSESPVTHYILSMATGQFVAITKSGRVQGNTQIGTVIIANLLYYNRSN